MDARPSLLSPRGGKTDSHDVFSEDRSQKNLALYCWAKCVCFVDIGCCGDRVKHKKRCFLLADQKDDRPSSLSFGGKGSINKKASFFVNECKKMHSFSSLSFGNVQASLTLLSLTASVDPPGLEPGTTEPKSAVLPLHHGSPWSGKRGSNSRPSAWEADALPTELFPRFVLLLMLAARIAGIFLSILFVFGAHIQKYAPLRDFKR